MIFYFSATGNTGFAAKRVAEAMGESQVVAIDECVREGRLEFRLQPDEVLGICCPTYDFGVPHGVHEFLEKVQFDGVGYSFAITTFGTFSGQSTGMIRELLGRKGIRLSAAYTIQSVDVWTPIFNLTDKAKNQRLVEGEKEQIDGIIEHLKKRDEGDFARMKLPAFIGRLVYRNYESKRRTSHLHATDACIGCGLCAKNCPALAIEVVDKRPRWMKEQCEMCLGCLHRCPKFAIQYDQKTQRHGQYQHKQYE